MHLSRDWLGPRDELIPFGPGAARAPDEPVPTAGEPPPATDNLPAGEPPPSAEDFWGERSAAIHGALQAPADWAPADWAPAHQEVPDRETLDPAGTDRGSVRARTICLGHAGRRALATAVGGLAAAAVIGIAVVSIFGAGPAPQPTGGSRAGVAAVLSGGVSQILQLGLARIDASLGQEGATLVAQSAAARARRTPHHEPAAKSRHKAPRPPRGSSMSGSSIDVARTTTAPTTAYQPAGTGTYDSNNSTSTNTPTSTPPAPQSSSPHAAAHSTRSRATASPTGESGALGPINSPNG